MNGLAIIEAPSVLGLRPTGVDRLPEALLEAGLAEAIGARRAECVVPRHAYDPRRDGPHAVLNAVGIAQYSPRLADAIGNVLDRGEFPIVLGGDCSILLGSMLALRRRGRYGLLFLDGHADFYQPEAEPNGEAASMDLALVTGRGPNALVDLEGLRPLVRDEDVSVLGYRDAEEQREAGSQPLPEAILSRDLATIRRRELDYALAEVLERLTDGGREGFWIHLDVDVLDDRIMPAVDYRLPGGLSYAELARALRAALATGQSVGLEVTIFNPTLDADGRIARALVRCLADGLTREGIAPTR